jgi:hypothetical protein
VHTCEYLGREVLKMSVGERQNHFTKSLPAKNVLLEFAESAQFTFGKNAKMSKVDGFVPRTGYVNLRQVVYPKRKARRTEAP